MTTFLVLLNKGIDIFISRTITLIITKCDSINDKLIEVIPGSCSNCNSASIDEMALWPVDKLVDWLVVWLIGWLVDWVG